jgi:hypothetical protein
LTRLTAILVLGYRRPELLRNRLVELTPWINLGKDIWVSIDGQTVSDEKMVKHFDSLENEFPSVNWIRHEMNLGIANHLISQVKACLEKYENVVVIEDDISISEKALQAMELVLSKKLDDSIMTVGMFGTLSNEISHFFPSNYWRKTRYFSAWGWGVQREAWANYDPDIVLHRGIQALNESSLWRELNDDQQRRWTYRFTKVLDNPRLTWDFQMQFLSFLSNKQHLLPAFRLCENVGFNDARATNTKSRRPGWYRGSKTEKIPAITDSQLGSYRTKFLESLDSFTWIGDRKLSDRRRKI